MHLVPALPQRARDLEPRRAGANHENARLRLLRRDALRMPALPPLFAHRRILRAPNRRDRHVTRYADVAADALADVVDPSFLDLLRQKRICNRWSRRSDHIEHTAPDLIHHRVR